MLATVSIERPASVPVLPEIRVLMYTMRSPFLPEIRAQSSGFVVFGRSSFSLNSSTNPDDWARISGKKGERIVYIRTLVYGKTGTAAGRSSDTVANTGQYL